MMSASRTTADTALPLVLVFLIASCCEATSANGITHGAATWRASPTSVPSLSEPSDVASFMFVGTELRRSPSSTIAAVSTEEMPTKAAATEEVAPRVAEGDESTWEATFAAGVFESKKAVESEHSDVGSWAADSNCGAAVPSRMLKAEVLLGASANASPEHWKEKTSERALRIYYHAKWLAERNYAGAAEHRYREAAKLAMSSRRTVLASHALARLGYFLIHWKRSSEAVVVLEESMKLNLKSNPLAPYLHGVLERKVGGGDIDRLWAAEELILNAGAQPSQELEAERGRLIEEISYWREAEASSRHCAAGSDVAYVLICFFGSAISFFQKAFFK